MKVSRTRLRSIKASLLGTACALGMLDASLGARSPAAAAASADKVYWIATGSVWQSDLDGGSPILVRTLSSGGSRDLAIDPANGKMYWSDNSQLPGRIMVGSLDGSGPEAVLLTTNAGEQVIGLEIDIAAQMIYWDGGSALRIYRASINSPSPTLILSTLPDVRDFALDLRSDKQHLYAISSERAYRSDLDGANLQLLGTMPYGDNYGVSVDTCYDKLYVVGRTSAHIGVPQNYVRCANLADFSNVQTLLIDPIGTPTNVGIEPRKIKLDTPRGRMYWTSEVGSFSHRGQLHRAYLDGTGVELLAQGSFLNDAFNALDLDLVSTPCFSWVSTYGTPGVSANGCQPTINTTGLPIASRNIGFDIWSVGNDGDRNGGFFYGTAGPQLTPFAAGYMCVAAPRQRLPVLTTGGTAGSCNGALFVDFNAYAAMNPGALSMPIAAGQPYYFQAYNRDPGSAGGLVMSNATAVTFFP